MTRSFKGNSVIRCVNCNAVVSEVVCPVCEKIMTLPEAPYRAWIRECDELGSSPHEAAISISDIDLAVHRYLVKDKATGWRMPRQHLMYIEVKCFCTSPDSVVPSAQHDTLNVIHQLTRIGKKSHVKARRGSVQVYYHGVHLLQFSGSDPRDSDTIWWNRKAITCADLIELFRFERDAYTLQPREDRNHHKKPEVFDDEWFLT